MKNWKYQPFSNTIRLGLMAVLAIAFTLGTGQSALAFASPAAVNLGAAAPFVILTKTGITNVPTSAITGDLGVSPIDSTAITGFALIADHTNTFSTSSQVTGKVYAANYTAPTPSNLTTAIGAMQAAYTDASGRALPDATELYSGDLSGHTLAPGLYKWSTGVLVNTSVTLSGPSNAVWIFQIAGNLTLGSGAKVYLTGGARASNVFWAVGGGVGVAIGTTAHMEGNILAVKAITFGTGASMNGRALAQTAVTLQKNIIAIPPTGSTFADVPSSYWANGFIERLYNAGITSGCTTTPLNYCPDATVTRAQMAVFLLKGIHGSSYVPPAVGVSTGFADVPVSYWAAAWIKELAAEGVSTGCGAGNYCPDQTVTRAQMAVLILKSIHGSSYAPPAVGVSTGFADVSVSYWAAAWIKEVAVEGITAGCSVGNYCPDANVTRAQMAVFLVQAFKLP